MARKPRTVLEACVAVMGVHRGSFAAAHIAQWAMTIEDLGRVPTTAEYADYWAVDLRTGWRHRAEAREVFGESWLEVVQLLADEIARRKLRSPRGVIGLAVAV